MPNRSVEADGGRRTPAEAALVPLRAGPIRPAEEAVRLIAGQNREFTFGFLLGYLSLALHSTLDYPRFAGYFVSPWEPEAPRAEEPLVRIWTTQIGRSTAYTPEYRLGLVVAVLSDGLSDPVETFRRLGAFADGEEDPPLRIVARRRRPRVDLVVQPTEGHAFELSEFARETAERFYRNLD